MGLRVDVKEWHPLNLFQWWTRGRLLMSKRHLLAVTWSTCSTSKLFSWQWTNEVASLLVLGLFSSSGTMRTERQDPGIEPWWELSWGGGPA
ncbi:hypothetical protein XELAEV_18001904mg [Xenopus laevis]|nr:hypothetical protein XELAEV_18001904mg [Xenopus laevis]